jgi:pyrroloquinoline quinone biosynthesis protein B
MKGVVHVLGSAAGGAVPQWNCACRVCRLAWAGDPRVAWRTQASLAVTGDGEQWTIIGAAPDLLTQIRSRHFLHPRTATLRGSPISAVVLASAEIDHVSGLLSLREGHAFNLIALPGVHTVLDSNPVFDALHPSLVVRRVAAPGESIAASPGIAIELHPVIGKVPLYLETERTDFQAEPLGATSAVVIGVNGRRVAYVPCCAAITDELLGLLSTADILFFDGTVFENCELISAGVGTKTGTRMGHVAISGPQGSLARFDRLTRPRRIFTHINNTNPVLIDASPERRAADTAGWEIAFDGMEIIP